MLDWILGILAFIIILTLIVGIHEGGHFFFAKKAGILCHEYAIGMGPVIVQKRHNETMWSLRAIPLGGYVSMAGEEVEEDALKDIERVKLVIVDGRVSKIITKMDLPGYEDLPEYKLVKYDLYGTKECLADELFIEVEDDSDESVHHELNTMRYIVNRDCFIVFKKKQELQIAPYDRTFVNKRFWQKFLTIIGGPLMNFVLAWFLFVIIGIFGGYANTKTTRVGSDTTTPGLQKGDEIVQIDEYSVDTSSWASVQQILNQYAKGEVASFNGKIEIKYNRNGEINQLMVEPDVVIYALEMKLQNQGDKALIAVYGDESTFEQTKTYKAGLRENDEIVKIIAMGDNNTVISETNITSINDVLSFFSNYKRANIKGNDLQIVVKTSDNEEKTYAITSYSDDVLSSQGLSMTKVIVGISPIYEFNFVKLLYEPILSTGKAAILVFDTLRLLFVDKTIGIKNLSGPIGILQIIKNALAGGILNVLNWGAIISVNVGFINLLPLPALDGGRLAFVIYEGITKKKPSPKVENIIHTVGFILLIGLFIFVAFNDIIRLIQSIF